MSRILIREGARPRVSGFFFKSIVQAVLLFGAYTWVVTPHMGWVLGGVPRPGGAATYGAAATAEVGRKVGLHLGGGGKIGGGV